jgi:hypothetical protein
MQLRSTGHSDLGRGENVYKNRTVLLGNPCI